MADARLAQIDIEENLAGGPGFWNLILTYWFLTQPNDIKRALAGVVPPEDIASEVAAYATANTITWV